MSIIRALMAEQLKTKRTLALWLAPVMPLVIVALQVTLVVQRQEYYRGLDPAAAWSGYAGQLVFLWTVLLLPLFITLETALLAQLEHGNRQWKHLFALAIPRSAIYTAKQISGLVLIGLSMAALLLYVVMSGLMLRTLTPGLGFEGPVPWEPIVEYVALSFLASWLIIAIHMWVALRWHSFVVASAVGICAMIVAVVAFQSDWSRWYPWTLPALVANQLGEGANPAWQVLAGSLGGVIVALVGGWDVTRRDVT